MLARSWFKASAVQHSVRDVEQLFIAVGKNLQRTIFGGVYIPLRSTEPIYQQHCYAIQEMQLREPAAKFVICRDFNVLCARWVDDEFILGPALDNTHCLADTYSYLNMLLINRKSTSRGAFLDLIFLSVFDLHVEMANYVLFYNSVHHSDSLNGESEH
ncbi:hypothetical protein HHI36_018126 [Cryptolaemus montrouzieri]|uniref:Uncharacterized protein n=1 Tax=Cryptolaemus montrouzieri TaxID=559131 RepID=A0ABD2NZG4_9CUCU